jgi:hypothetical protein
LSHSPASNTLRIFAYDSTGALIHSAVTIGPSWNPTAGTEYEFELNIDTSVGMIRLFIDGALHGSTTATTYTRTNTATRLSVGASPVVYDNADAEFDDVIVFSTVQHTSGYTPGYTLQENRYLEDLITLPNFSYSGIGSIQDYTAFATTQTGAIRLNVNGQYWDGGAWVASDDSYAQMNSPSDINANIGSLTESDTVSIKLRTQDSATIQDIDDLTVTYTGQIYPTDNPTVVVDSAIVGTVSIGAWNSFTETITAGGSDSVKYTLSDDNGVTYKYWNGAAWVTSSGFAQSNTGTEVDTNIGSFPLVTAGMKIQIFLHSDDGSSTPAIDTLVVNYDDQEYPVDNPTVVVDSAITGTVSIGAWNSFTETITALGSDSVKYTLSDDNGSTYKYWNGSAWVTSSGFAQSNTGTEVDTNIASFPLVAAGMKIQIFLHSDDSTTTPDIDTLVVNYDDQTYPTDNPTIEGNATFRHEGLESFTATESVTGNDEIRYILKKGSDWYYWDGAAWTISDETFAQSNTEAEISANVATFTTVAVVTTFRAFLHSDTGLTNPEIDIITIEYDFSGDNPDSLNTCIVWGYSKAIDGSIFTEDVIVFPEAFLSEYKTNTQVHYDKRTTTPDSTTGYWEIELIITDSNFGAPIPTYTFIIQKQRYTGISIPDQETVNFNDLIP